MTAHVRKNAERQRYEIVLDDLVVGYADYERHGDAIAIPHTFVDPERRGANLAFQLVTFALDDIRAQGLSVLPVCPYVRRVIERDPATYRDLVPEPERGSFGIG